MGRAKEAECMVSLDQEARRQYSDKQTQQQQNVNLDITADENGELQAKLAGGKASIAVKNINQTGRTGSNFQF